MELVWGRGSALRRRLFASQQRVSSEDLRRVFEKQPLKPLPADLKKRADAAAAVYNRRFQQREYRLNADISDKIQLMHRAIDALPTPRMRELAREHDNAMFPMDRFIPTHNPPPFREYDDETGADYAVQDKNGAAVDPASLGYTVFDLFERAQRLR